MAELAQIRHPVDPGTREVDDTLILWMLSLTPLERLQVLQDFVDGVTALRNGRRV